MNAKENTTTVTFRPDELRQLLEIIRNGYGDGDWEESYCTTKAERQAFHRGWDKLRRAAGRLGGCMTTQSDHPTA